MTAFAAAVPNGPFLLPSLPHFSSLFNVWSHYARAVVQLLQRRWESFGLFGADRVELAPLNGFRTFSVSPGLLSATGPLKKERQLLDAFCLLVLVLSLSRTYAGWHHRWDRAPPSSSLAQDDAKCMAEGEGGEGPLRREPWQTMPHYLEKRREHKVTRNSPMEKNSQYYTKICFFFKNHYFS